MRGFIMSAAAAAVLAAAAPAGAVTVANPLAVAGTLTEVDLTLAGPSKDLTNNGPYSSGQGVNAKAYLFHEGVNNDGNTTYLLHYDRSGLFTSGFVEGSFQFLLSANEGFTAVFASSLDLANSDDLDNGVTYQRCLACLDLGATILRGLELPPALGFDDVVNITPDQALDQTAGLYTVSYRFRNAGPTLDEVRFVFSPGFTPVGVPEPATWALMIGGFALAGAALRRRRAQPA